jgi:hypothetical protein
MECGMGNAECGREIVMTNDELRYSIIFKLLTRQSEAIQSFRIPHSAFPIVIRNSIWLLARKNLLSQAGNFLEY